MPRRVPPTGDLSTSRTFTEYSLDLLNAGNQSDGTTRIKDLEVEWDTAPAELKPQDTTTWTVLDGTIDTELREPRTRTRAKSRRRSPRCSPRSASSRHRHPPPAPG